MIKQLTPLCFALLHPISNQYLINCNRQWILIDAGLAGYQRTLLKHIREIIPADEQVSAILITHADADHCGGAAYIRDKTLTQLYSSQYEATAMRNGEMSRPLTPLWWQKPIYALLTPLFATKKLHSINFLDTGKAISWNTALQIIDSQGHTPGHVSIYWQTEGILFAGDSIRKAGKSPAPSSGANTWDVSKSKQSFTIQMELCPAIIGCGHTLFDFR